MKIDSMFTYTEKEQLKKMLAFYYINDMRTLDKASQNNLPAILRDMYAENVQHYRSIARKLGAENVISEIDEKRKSKE